MSDNGTKAQDAPIVYAPPQPAIQQQRTAPQTMFPPPGGYPAPGNQPSQQEMWMMVPQGVPGCPPGLEYLTMIDQLLIHQKVELLEVLVGFETNNKYAIRNSMGQNVYNATEDTDCCTRYCCGPLRPFDIWISDNTGRRVIHLNRPLSCQGCCCPCCLQSLDVFAPPGQFIGRVREKHSCAPHFTIENATGDTILKIERDCCQIQCCGDVEFKVLALDGITELGKISKQWSGITKELFTDADNFGITFPMDLNVNAKAVLLGAVFLIDFMFFEHSN